jgi:hypothetical protein
MLPQAVRFYRPVAAPIRANVHSSQERLKGTYHENAANRLVNISSVLLPTVTELLLTSEEEIRRDLGSPSDSGLHVNFACQYSWFSRAIPEKWHVRGRSTFSAKRF